MGDDLSLVPAIWIGTPSYECANFARTLGHSIPKNGHSKVWVEIPLVKSNVMLRDEDDEVRREDDPWEAWNNLRTYCEHHPSYEKCPSINFLVLHWSGARTQVL